MNKRTTMETRTAAEKPLDAVRRSSSPTINDPKQLDLFDYVRDKQKREAFTKLDGSIAAELEKARWR